jgi:hypothetical protein
MATNFAPDGTALRLQVSGYTWDGTTAPSSSGSVIVPLDIDDNEHDVRAKVIDAIATTLSIDKKDVVFVS